MEIVLLTALGVRGATVLGAVHGFSFKNISHKFSDIAFGFTGETMLYVISDEIMIVDFYI